MTDVIAPVSPTLFTRDFHCNTVMIKLSISYTLSCRSLDVPICSNQFRALARAQGVEQKSDTRPSVH